MNYTQILNEIQQSSTEEYTQALQAYYKGEDALMNLILASEEQLGMFIDTDQIQTEKTDDGNLIIRYYEDDEQVIILGMISKTGRLNRNELVELQEWLGRLKEKMKEGVPVISSMNQLSMPIFNRIVKQLESEGFEVNKTEFNKTRLAGQEWTTYIFQVGRDDE
jgi:hypothetical protein